MEIATTLALLVGVFMFLAIGVAPHIFGYRPVTMLSGSMTPTIRPGDMVVDTPEPLRDVRVGQIITFHTPTATGYVDSHRVTHVQRLPSGAVVIRTKGDANKVEDPWHAELHGSTAWRVRMVVPRLGYLINALRGPGLHALLLWIVPPVLVGWLLAGIWRPRRREAYAG
jgi:signal peptidase